MYISVNPSFIIRGARNDSIARVYMHSSVCDAFLIVCKFELQLVLVQDRPVEDRFHHIRRDISTSAWNFLCMTTSPVLSPIIQSWLWWLIWWSSYIHQVILVTPYQYGIQFNWVIRICIECGIEFPFYHILMIIYIYIIVIACEGLHNLQGTPSLLRFNLMCPLQNRATWRQSIIYQLSRKMITWRSLSCQVSFRKFWQNCRFFRNNWRLCSLPLEHRED